MITILRTMPEWATILLDKRDVQATLVALENVTGLEDLKSVLAVLATTWDAQSPSEETMP